MIQGIVLAAGLGRRIGTPKALLSLAGATFHERAVRALREAQIEVLAVTNPQIDKDLPISPGERRVINADPDQGMFSSVKLGVGAALALKATGVILLPVDHPLVTSDDVSLIATALRRGALIVVATHGGRRGHPIGLGTVAMNEVVTDAEVGTLRDVVHRDPVRVVEVAASEGSILGVNTKEDLPKVSDRSFR